MQEGKKPRAVWIRRIAWAAAGLLLLGWMVPMLVRLNYWQEEITTSLSEAFHRPVRTGDIRPQLLGGLGFDIENVILEEDPRFGIEPFARMESLQARVALRSLLGGGVEFSSLTFVRPSLNVVRNAAGEWNLESFGRREGSLADDLASEASDEEVIHTVLPQIRIESGRVNFKAASYKRAFTLNSLDLELSPPKVPHQPWAFRFEGTPGRTDIPLRFGDRWAGEGEFGPFTSQIQEETGIPLRLDWWTEDVLLAELLSVFAGRDFGVHGTVSLQGHLAGTTSLLRLTARTELRDAHRWDLVPSREARVIPGEVSGFLDLKDDSLQLTSISIPVGDGSVVLRGRVEDLLDNPRLETEAEL
ncbi:MAG TPA: AsmA family protein, partial [Terriglobia bacterium]